MGDVEISFSTLDTTVFKFCAAGLTLYRLMGWSVDLQGKSRLSFHLPSIYLNKARVIAFGYKLGSRVFRRAEETRLAML